MCSWPRAPQRPPQHPPWPWACKVLHPPGRKMQQGEGSPAPEQFTNARRIPCNFLNSYFSSFFGTVHVEVWPVPGAEVPPQAALSMGQLVRFWGGTLLWRDQESIREGERQQKSFIPSISQGQSGQQRPVTAGTRLGTSPSRAGTAAALGKLLFPRVQPGFPSTRCFLGKGTQSNPQRNPCPDALKKKKKKIPVRNQLPARNLSTPQRANPRIEPGRKFNGTKLLGTIPFSQQNQAK